QRALRGGGELEEIQAALAGAEAAVLEHRTALKEERGEAPAVLDQRLRRDREHGGGVAHRASRVRAAARAHHIGIAGNDAHALDRDAEELSNDLREAGLMPLAARLRADHHAHAALGKHGDLGALLRRADRRLDVARKADAEPAAAP